MHITVEGPHGDIIATTDLPEETLPELSINDVLQLQRLVPDCRWECLLIGRVEPSHVIFSADSKFK